MFVVPIYYFFYFCDTPKSNYILYEVMPEFIFSTELSGMSLPNLEALKLNTYLSSCLSDWFIHYLTVLQ
jgi:hypothetical protein